MLTQTSPSCEQLSIPPWGKPRPIPTVIAPVDKRMSPFQQIELSLQTLASIPKTDFQIYLDGSVRYGIVDGGAGLVVLSQVDLVHEWHAPSGTHYSSLQAEKAAHKEAIQWPFSISSWASAIIICHCKSLVQAVMNANSADSSVIQLQASAAVLAMSKSILIVWDPGHCGLSDDELADHHVKLGAAETQPDYTLEPVTRRAVTHRSCRPHSIQHERLKEEHASLPDEQIKTSVAKAERTDLAHFRCGHHPALRRWQHLVGILEDAVCRLCGEKVESTEHLWLRCPALLVERHHSDIDMRWTNSSAIHVQLCRF